MTAPLFSSSLDFDPALLTGVRDHLAANFAAMISAALPEVSGFIEFESEMVANSDEKLALGHASRQLYSRRTDVEARITVDFVAAFDAIVDPVKARSRRPRAVVSTLKLVDDAEMAEEIALIDCSHRLKEQSDYELFALTRLISLLVGRERLLDEGNPVLPRVFANVLMQALGSIQDNATVKLAIFKSFGPLLLEILPATYRAGSEWLKQHGVELDAYVYRPVLTPERPVLVAPMQAGLAADAVLLGELFNALRAAQPAAIGSPAAAATVAAITAGQQNVAPHATLSSTGAPASPASQLALTARVTAAMFDILGEDSRIPVSMRPIVERLRGPLARLAGNDSSFLTRAAHPARKLLERIAEAGMLVDIDSADSAVAHIADSISRIVEDVIRTVESDPHAFRVGNDRLEQLVALHEEIALQNDPEVNALQQSERMKCAHDAANAVISRRLDGRKLPDEMVAFVLITWRTVLVADYLHGGLEGQAWKLGVATLDELLQSIEPVFEPETRAVRTRSLASLVELIRDGIDHAQLHPLLSEDFLKGLEVLHMLALKGRHDESLDSAVPLSYPQGAAQETTPAASDILATLGLARGSFLEMCRDGRSQRWRLVWVTPYTGQCVLKSYEPRTTHVVALKALRAEIGLGSVNLVDSLGLVGAAISAAFKRVNQAIPPPATLKLIPGGLPRRAT